MTTGVGKIDGAVSDLMRRAFAILLVTVFGLPLIAPALVSVSNDAPLPACCRRDGKHHCAMAVEVGNIPSGARVISERCPYCPFSATPLLQPHPFATVSSPAVVGGVQGVAAVVRAAEAGYRISADRNHHKRGPPAALAL